MTVTDLLPRLPLSYEEGRTYGLVFDAALAQRLAEVQAEHPSQFVAQPVPLADGRYLLCGDLLSEVPNGLYGVGFWHLDASRFSEIEVIAWDDAVALLPPDTPELTAPASSPTLSPTAAPSGGGTLAPGVAPSLGGAIVR